MDNLTTDTTATVFGGNSADSNATVFGGNSADSNATVFGGNSADSNATVFGGNSADSNATISSSTQGTSITAVDTSILFDNKYKIISKIGGVSSQANVYLAEFVQDSTQVALKVYGDFFKPDYDMIEKFKKIDSPYLAKLLDYGSFNGKFYEVYKYYKNGSITEKMHNRELSEEFVEKVAIVSLDNAIHTLHTMGIVHADVKPENILLGDDGQHLVLSDYGICVQLTKDGYAFKEIQGTMAYAPRAEQHFKEMKIDPSWDYGALGLVLIALLCGNGMFDDMTNDEIFREWEKGVEIPGIITGRMRSLIEGLINTSSSERFGHSEVARWCEGDIVKTSFKRKVSASKTVEPLIIAIVDGKVISVKSPEEFARESLKNWNAVKTRMFESTASTSKLKRFLQDSGEDCYEKISRYMEYTDKDKALFCVAYTLFPLKDIYYKGKFLGNLENLFASQNISENAGELMDFVKSDLLEFYLEVNEYPSEVMSSIRAIVDIAGNDGEFLYYLLMYSFSAEKTLCIHDKKISSIDELSDFVVSDGAELLFADDIRTRFYAWLYCMGYGREVSMMRKRDNNE